jgi:hypothetical protein
MASSYGWLSFDFTRCIREMINDVFDESSANASAADYSTNQREA